MKIKKNKFIIASMFTMITLFSNGMSILPINNITGFQNINVAYADSSTDSNKSNNTDINEVSSTETTYKLINDSTKTLTDEDINNISDNLNNIFEHSKNKENNHQFRLYTFIYNNPNKSVVSAENEIISKYKLSNAINPVIFIYNQSNNDYRFVIDERINSYVSKSYYQNMVNTVLLNDKKMTKESLNEFLIRIASITGVAIRDDMSSIANNNDKEQQVKGNNFDVRSFGTDTSISNKSKDKSDNNETSKTTNKEESNNMMYFLLPLLLAFISIGVVLLKRKKKFNIFNKKKG